MRTECCLAGEWRTEINKSRCIGGCVLTNWPVVARRSGVAVPDAELLSLILRDTKYEMGSCDGYFGAVV